MTIDGELLERINATCPSWCNVDHHGDAEGTSAPGEQGGFLHGKPFEYPDAGVTVYAVVEIDLHGSVLGSGYTYDVDDASTVAAIQALAEGCTAAQAFLSSI